MSGEEGLLPIRTLAFLRGVDAEGNVGLSRDGPQSVGDVSLFRFMTSAQIADVQSRTNLIDVTTAINSAFAAGVPLAAPPGLYRIDGQLNLPTNDTFSLRATSRDKVEFRAGTAMTYMMAKASRNEGASTNPVFINNILLNCNRLAQTGMRIGASKSGALHNIKTISPLAGGFLFGEENGTTTASFYENFLTKLTPDGNSVYQADSPPTYGVKFNDGATDNTAEMITASYLDLTTGRGCYNKGAGNIIRGCHTYGGAYNVTSNIFCQIVDPYSDSMSVAGIKIEGEGVIVVGGEYYWPVGSPLPAAGAVPIEIADGLQVVSIIGGLVRNDSSSNPYIRGLGSRPARLSCSGMTPARNPVAVFASESSPTGNQVAHLVENSISVRAPSSATNALLEMAGPTSGKALAQWSKNGVLRYTFGTDATNTTGTGDSNENFEMYAIKDDGSSFQMFKWFRGTKTWFINDSVCISAAAGKIGFYNATPIVKPAITGSRGGNAALASLLTTLATMGLITDSSSA